MFDIRIWGHKKVKDGMSDGHVPTAIGFQEYEVPPTAEINSLGYFQAESAGRVWLVRKSSISATTFDFSILTTRRLKKFKADMSE